MHLFFKNSYQPPFSDKLKSICLGMGCFWGAERVFWKTKGVYTTAVGYAGGNYDKPTYEKVCTGETNHAEVVLVVFNPEIISLKKILNIFFVSHDPTQVNRQGNDIGSQYRSIILVTKNKDLEESKNLLVNAQKKFFEFQLGKIETEIKILDKFHYAEEYHQQYLIRNPNGYCNLKNLSIDLD